GCNQRAEAGVRKLAASVQFYLAVSSVGASHQCRIGNTEVQMRYIHESDRFTDMTLAYCQVSRRIVELFQQRTLRAPFNRAGPQHHSGLPPVSREEWELQTGRPELRHLQSVRRR